MATKNAAGAVKVVLSVEAASYSVAVDKAKAKINELAGAADKMSQHTVSGAAAASGALRTFEGSIPIRAAEKFLALIPGVGAALQVAFPIFGALALIRVIAKGGEELLAFRKKSQEAGDKFKAEWQSIANSSRLSNDELEKSNIQLEAQIAKLTGKHQNVLASQLIEARIEADHLAESAASAVKQIKQLLEENKASFLSQLAGSGSTSEVFGNIQNFANLKSEARQRESDALHSGDKTGADKAKADYETLLNNERAYYLEQIRLRTGSSTVTSVDSEGNQSSTQLSYAQQHGNQTGNITALRGALSLNYGESDRIGLDAQHNTDIAAEKKLRDAKDLQAHISEETRKLLEKYRNEFADLQGTLTIKPEEDSTDFRIRELASETQFWQHKLSITKQGTEAYAQIQKQLQEVNKQSNQEFALQQNEAIKLAKDQAKIVSEIAAPSSQDLARDSDTLKSGRDDGKAAIGFLKALNESVVIARQNADAISETAISIGLADGSISKYDAATQMAMLHTQQYSQSLSDLRDQLKKIADDPTLSDLEKQQQSQDIENRITDLKGRRGIQVIEDAQNVGQQTGTGSLRQSLNQYVQQTKDTASQVREVWNSTLSGINDEFLRLISGQRTNWKKLFEGIAGDLARVGLQKGEGALLSAIGLTGKPDGTAGNPLHVVLAGAAGAASGAASGVLGLLSKFGGFFAGGGPTPGAHVPIVVGEEGPELFRSRSQRISLPCASPMFIK